MVKVLTEMKIRNRSSIWLFYERTLFLFCPARFTLSDDVRANCISLSAGGRNSCLYRRWSSSKGKRWNIETSNGMSNDSVACVIPDAERGMRKSSNDESQRNVSSIWDDKYVLNSMHMALLYTFRGSGWFTRRIIWMSEKWNQSAVTSYFQLFGNW